MDSREILVHIAAPSRFKDDQRYRAQAEAVLQFQPAKLTAVYPGGSAGGDDSGVETTPTESSNESFETSLGGWTDIVKETPAQIHARHMLSNTDKRPVFRASNTPSPSLWRITKQNTKSRKSQSSLHINNPPYKNPLLMPAPPTIHAVRTPDPPRPNTAPEGDSRHRAGTLKGWVSRKRAYSDSSSFESISTFVPESQMAQDNKKTAHGSESSTQYFSASNTTEHHIHTFSGSKDKDDKGEDDEPPPKRLRGMEQDRCNARSRNDETQPEPVFLRDRSLDWTTSSAPSSPDRIASSSASTETPSPQSASEFHQPASDSPPRQHPAYQNPSSPINLISQELPSSPQELTVSLSQLLSQPDSPPHPPSNIEMPYPAITVLPLTIFPPPPSTGHTPFRTHITSTLSEIVSSVPIVKGFRPIYVARDVRVLERGYWLLPITIANPEVVNEARRAEAIRDDYRRKRRMEHKLDISGTSAEEMKSYDDSRRKNNERWSLCERSSCVESDADDELSARTCGRGHEGLWTEQEFLEFWSALEKKIGSGEAGWGIRVFRLDPQDEEEPIWFGGDRQRLHSSEGGSLSGKGGPERRLVLRVSTWGEVIPHIWLLLWVLSNKLTAYIRMEWRAGDDSVIVMMSGHRRKHGLLGDWIMKRSKGEFGVWGIEQEVDAPEASVS